MSANKESAVTVISSILPPRGRGGGGGLSLLLCSVVKNAVDEHRLLDTVIVLADGSSSCFLLVFRPLSAFCATPCWIVLSCKDVGMCALYISTRGRK